MAPSSYEFDYFKVSFPSEYVAQVEIDRPERLNSFIEAMWLNLSKIFARLSHDPDVRAIFITSSGDRAFSAGLDVQAASQGILSRKSTDSARTAVPLRRHILEFQDCITKIEQCEKPVIILLHGIAYGLAIDISTACDIRFCTRDVRFSVKEVDIGLAADIGTLTRLPKVVGNHSWVKDVCYTARDFGAEEAMRVGFVSGVAENKEEGRKMALEMCRTIAEKSPVAVMGTKEVLNYSRDHSTEDGLRYTAIWNAGMLQTADIKSAMLSGLQKRKPKFAKL